MRWESKTHKQLCRSYLFDKREHSKIRNDRIKEQKAGGEYEKWQQKKQYEYDTENNQRETRQADRRVKEESPSARKEQFTEPNGPARMKNRSDRESRRADISRSRSRSMFSDSRSPSYSIQRRGRSDSRTPQRMRSTTPQRKSDADENVTHAKVNEPRQVAEQGEAQAFKCHDCYVAPKPQEDESYLRSALADIRDRRIPQEMLFQMLSEFGLLPPAQKVPSPPSCELKRANETSLTRRNEQAKKISESPAKGPRNSHSQGESPKRKRSKKRKQKSRSRTQDEDQFGEKEKKKKKKKRKKVT